MASTFEIKLTFCWINQNFIAAIFWRAGLVKIHSCAPDLGFPLITKSVWNSLVWGQLSLKIPKYVKDYFRSCILYPVKCPHKTHLNTKLGHRGLVQLYTTYELPLYYSFSLSLHCYPHVLYGSVRGRLCETWNMRMPFGHFNFEQL